MWCRLPTKCRDESRRGGHEWPRHLRRFAGLSFFLGVSLQAADSWEQFVTPVLSKAERSRYEAMPEAARASFREHFWDDKSITLTEYSERVAYIDATFGSGKAGSGINTDQGRVYLSLGAPNRVTHLPSSRTFVPLEIWYYAHAPVSGTGSELRLLFYQKNSTGIPHLYSPTLDTIRALLVPQPGAVHLFGPNETIDTAALQTKLAARPVENEVLDAAVAVAQGVRGEENETILARAMSPAAALRASALRAQVHSRVLRRSERLDIMEVRSPYGGVQVDLHATVQAAKSIRLEITDPHGTLYSNALRLNFEERREVDYVHRLDLLPGDYTVILMADEATSAHPLHVAANATGELYRANVTIASRNAPFTFDAQQFELNPAGQYVLLAAAPDAEVSWLIRRGPAAVWKGKTIASGVAVLELPALPPGEYGLEAATNGESRRLALNLSEPRPAQNESVISFNANLNAPDRLSFLGRQALRRNQLGQAQQYYASSGNRESIIGLSRIDAIQGRLDEARERLRPILARDPDNYDALLAMAYVESRFQDSAAADAYYRHAMAVLR